MTQSNDPYLLAKIDIARKRAIAARDAESIPGGRAYIGPKAQAAVSTEVFLAVCDIAEQRGCDMSEVWRDLIYRGYEQMRSVERGAAIARVGGLL